MKITILGISYWPTQKGYLFLIGCLSAGWKRRGLRPDWWSRRKLCSCCCTRAACSAATSYITFNIFHYGLGNNNLRGEEQGKMSSFKIYFED
jgi:hypothetical protein